MKRSKFTRVLAGLLAVVMVLVCLPTAGAAQAGQFVLAVVTQEQVLVEPETVSYGPGDTVRTALKNSGHSFEGIDTGFVFAIDGVEDNYSLFYDEGGLLHDEAGAIFAPIPDAAVHHGCIQRRYRRRSGL